MPSDLDVTRPIWGTYNPRDFRLPPEERVIEPPGHSWCTRRISPSCEVLTPVHPNVPSGSMCAPCSILIHRYFCAIAKGDERFAQVRRVQAIRRGKPRGRGKRVAGPAVRKCGFEGCSRPVHRTMEYGVWVEHRFLCLYHFKCGEDLQAGG